MRGAATHGSGVRRGVCTGPERGYSWPAWSGSAGSSGTRSRYSLGHLLGLGNWRQWWHGDERSRWQRAV